MLINFRMTFLKIYEEKSYSILLIIVLNLIKNHRQDYMIYIIYSLLFPIPSP